MKLQVQEKSTSGSVDISHIARRYGMNQIAFKQTLAKFDLLTKYGRRYYNKPNYLKEGFIKPIELIILNGSARDYLYRNEWTDKGQAFLYNELKKHGILPLLERKSVNP